MVVICLGCYQRPCACPQDVIATPPPGSVQSDAAALDAREAPRLPGGDIPAARRSALCSRDGHIARDGRCAWCGEAVPSVPFGEPDDAEARAYLDALRMALHVLAGGDEVSPAARAVLIADIRSVVGLFGRSPELGGAREGTS